MTHSILGNRELIKAMNRNLLLNTLRREGPLSRTQLTEISSLSGGAVSQLINELIEEAWLFESGEGDYTGGRRQVLVRLNPQAGYALGLKVMETRVVCAITDFEARVLHYGSYLMTDIETPDRFAAVLARIIEQTLRDSGLPRDKCFGIGVGLAGVINPHAGVVRFSPYLGFTDVPLTNLLQSILDLPVVIENDVNTLTLTEHLFGAGRHHQNFIVMTVGRGVGMGMVLQGHLYQGAHGGAGELGHTIIDLDRARRISPQAGSLEILAADPAVLEAAQQASLDAVILAAEAGDHAAQSALQRSGEYLGVALAGVINILSPTLVIISGEGVSAGDLRLKPMLEAARRYTFRGLFDRVKIVIEPAGDQTWARGAAVLVLNRVFESPLVAQRSAQ